MATVQQPNVEVPVLDALVSQPPSLALQRAPEVVLEEASRAAQALRDVIERKPAKVVINGKTFLQFEDWQTLGRFYGVTAAARSTTLIEEGRVRGYEAHADAILVSTGVVISSAQAMCLDNESKWSDKPIFQLRSMAQTRACAKALRNVLAWVVVLAGYQPTPAEEIEDTPPRTNESRRNTCLKPIPIDRVRALCTRIANAPNLEELKRVYLEAGHQAQAVNDRMALEAFIAAKDARKRELR